MFDWRRAVSRAQFEFGTVRTAEFQIQRNASRGLQFHLKIM